MVAILELITRIPPLMLCYGYYVTGTTPAADATQQQNFNYAASAYTTGYQNPNYGYGYEAYNTAGATANAGYGGTYAQGHNY